MNKSAKMKSITDNKSVVALAVTTTIMLLSCSVFADHEVWFPYAVAIQNLRFDPEGEGEYEPPTNDVTILGESSAPIYKKIHYPSTDNVIWNTSRVFYDTGNNRGYFSACEDGKYEWHLQIHNTQGSTQTYYIYMYEYNATQVNESTNWQYSGEDLIYSSISTNPYDDFYWDTTNDRFVLTLDSGDTQLIGCWDYPPYQFFNKPVADEGYSQFFSSIKIVSSYEFEAGIYGASLGRYREDDEDEGEGNTDNFSDQKGIHMNFTYSSIDVTEYDSESDDTLLLPYFRERYLVTTGTDAWSGWSGLDSRTYPDEFTWCYVTNTSNSTDTITITVYKQDGTIYGSSYDKELDANESFIFMPSQFFVSENLSSGYDGFITVEGARPAAIAIYGRCSKLNCDNLPSNNTTKLFRIPVTQLRPFDLAE